MASAGFQMFLFYWATMKIFITGITGLLGWQVAELCSRNGHEVVALTRNKTINNSHFPFGVHIVHGDLTDAFSMKGILAGTGVVINCAADTSMHSRDNKKQHEININGLTNLMNEAKKVGITRFVHISSANTIVGGNESNPSDESNKRIASPGNLSYINSKIIGEEILLEAYRASGFPVIILNPTFILGPGNSGKSSNRLIISAIHKKLFFYPEGGKNIVDVRDVALAGYNAILKGNVGHNYLLANENIRYKEIFKLACGFANVSPPKHPMPRWLQKFVGYTGDLYEMMSGRTVTINSKTLHIASENTYYNAGKAKADLGFNPRPVEETIRDTVTWFSKE
jgi:dihydroflavonol-4-reductase